MIERRQVTFEEGEEFAKENGLMFLETSAKSAYNVDDVKFYSLPYVQAFIISAKRILEDMDQNKIQIEEKVYINV